MAPQFGDASSDDSLTILQRYCAVGSVAIATTLYLNRQSLAKYARHLGHRPPEAHQPELMTDTQAPALPQQYQDSATVSTATAASMDESLSTTEPLSIQGLDDVPDQESQSSSTHNFKSASISGLELPPTPPATGPTTPELVGVLEHPNNSPAILPTLPKPVDSMASSPLTFRETVPHIPADTVETEHDEAPWHEAGKRHARTSQRHSTPTPQDRSVRSNRTPQIVTTNGFEKLLVSSTDPSSRKAKKNRRKKQ